ncbi:MAG: 8-amino-7-oxononanoate synthase [Abditibacteriaceae bacterium]
MHDYADQLSERQQSGLLRKLRQLPNGVIDLASNDYLHLARNPEVIETGVLALKQFGAGGRSSRLVSGQMSPHQKLEYAITQFKHTEAALVFPSGYHANLSAITALAQPNDFIFCDKRNHASLIDACRLASSQKAIVRYFSRLKKLENLLKSTFAGHPESRRFIVSDGVFSMDGDLAHVPELLVLAERFDALLLLDDAHGTGTLGATGHGTAEYFGVKNSPRIIHIGTLSKAIGGQGGFVAASQQIIDWLINQARPFIYTTALNPASCASAQKSFEIIEREPQMAHQLRAITEQLAHGLQELGWNAVLQPSPIIPVIIGEAQDALKISERLLQHGIWCPAIRPPTVPAGKSRLRLTANLSLAESDIAKVLLTFKNISKSTFIPRTMHV